MSYATLQDLLDRAGEDELLQVADRDDDGIADAAVVAAALDQADQRINVALAVRYRMPLASPPPIVVGWAVSIARYILHRQGQPDYVVRDYTIALADLDKAVLGKIEVPGADGLLPAAATTGATISEGSEPAFTRDRLEGWL